jgi:hypothetical protein
MNGYWGSKLAFAAMAVAVMLICRTAAAAPRAQQIKITVSLLQGTPAPSSLGVQFLDAGGTLGDCSSRKAGTFTCDTTGATAPLLLKGGTLYGYSTSLTGNAAINGITDLGVNQIFQAWNTSPNEQWVPSTPPIQIPQPVLYSGNALLDRTFLQPLIDYKIKSPLTYDFFSSKYKFKSGLGKLLDNLSYSGIGTATEGVDTTLPGGISFGATMSAMSSVQGTLSRWTVQASGGISYQSAYAKFPVSPDAPAVFKGVQNFYNGFLGILKHEKSLLDASNLTIYSSLFFNNGNDATTQSWIDATRLRDIKVKYFALGPIASFRENQPSLGNDLIGIDVFRYSMDHGIPCLDLCCEYFACGSDGSNCLLYGNQRIGSFRLSAALIAQLNGSSPSISSVLNTEGSGPAGTLDGYHISDLQGIFNNTPIPFQKTRSITVTPFHNGSSQTLDYDQFKLHTTYTPPVDYSDRFTVDISPILGSPQSFTAYPPSSTTEPFKLLSPSSTDLHDFLGKSVRFKFSLPDTFVVNRQSAIGIECTASDSKILNSIPPRLKPSAKSVKFKTDKQLNGDPVIGVEYRFTQSALDGPRTQFVYPVGVSCNF